MPILNGSQRLGKKTGEFANQKNQNHPDHDIVEIG